MLIYRKEDGDEGDLVEIEEESPDAINKDIDFGDRAQDTMMKSDNNEQEAVSEILQPSIPPEDFQREIEKVSSKLKMDYNTNIYNSVEWRSHVEQIRNNEGVWIYIKI
jgi:hypothetical protein